MDDLSDRTAFLLEDHVRLAVARACHDAARTKSQIARKLQREPGSLSAIATLEKKGALLDAGQAPARGARPGGKRWKLNPTWADALEAAESDAERGGLADGIDIVLVPAGQTQSACEALASGDAVAAWGVPLRGEQMGLLLCPSGTGADDRATLRLVAALASRGANALRLHVDRVMPRRELRAWAEHVAHGDVPSLPRSDSAPAGSASAP